jgi:hypothetical protein
MSWYKIAKEKSYWTKGQTFTDRGVSYNVDLLIDHVSDHDMKVEDISVSDLEHHLDNNIWETSPKTLTPRMVLENPKKNKEYKDHYKRIEDANLDKPILIKESDDVIIDGAHRISKAYKDGIDSLPSIKISQDLLDKFRIDKS